MTGPLVAGKFPRDIQWDAHYLMDSNSPEDNLLQNKQYMQNVILEKGYISKETIYFSVKLKR